MGKDEEFKKRRVIMKRREAVIKMSWILKSAILAPTVLSVLQSCQEQVLNSRDLLILNDKQDDLIKAIADTILPRTESPSASDVKVDRFMDLLLHDVFEAAIKNKFLEGLSQFDADCQNSEGSGFVDLNELERTNYLEKIDAEIMGQEYDDLVPFYYTFKHLAITIYFTTEQGVKQNLNYMPVPGPYVGEVDLKPEDKIIIGNKM